MAKDCGMMIPFKIRWLALLTGLLFVATTRAEETPFAWDGPIKSEHVRPHVEFLASPKLAGRAGPDAAKAAEYVRQQFEAFRLKPLFADGSFEQPIPTSADVGPEKSNTVDPQD